MPRNFRAGGKDEDASAGISARAYESGNPPVRRRLLCGAREQATEKPAIALRADYDALATPDGGAAHLCGHDGHAASLCAVALALEGRTLHRNVFLLFQPAEETGAGAYPCCELFEKEQIGEIYGAHNLPGFPQERSIPDPARLPARRAV